MDHFTSFRYILPGGGGGGVGGILPSISYMGMCCCKGCGFQAVYSGIGYRNHHVLF